MSADTAMSYIGTELRNSREVGGFWLLFEQTKQDLLAVLNETKELSEIEKNGQIFSEKVSSIIKALRVIYPTFGAKMHHDLINILVNICSVEEHIDDVGNLTNVFNPDDEEGLDGKDMIEEFGHLEDVMKLLQSVYLSSLSDTDAPSFIENQKQDYNLYQVFEDICKTDKRGIPFCTDIDIGNNIMVNGLEGDMKIFLRGILVNSKGRGHANHARAYIEEHDEKKYLCIADNGTGIDTSVFPDPNDILIRGNTSTGTGWGLRDLEKRQIECSVSNEGLPSRFSDLNDIQTYFDTKIAEYTQHSGYDPDKVPTYEFGRIYNSKGSVFRIEL